MMAARTYSPPSMTIRLFQKDLRIITEFAKSCGVPVPLLATASQLFAAALDEEFGELDTASVHEASLRAATSPGPPQPGNVLPPWPSTVLAVCTSPVVVTSKAVIRMGPVQSTIV